MRELYMETICSGFSHCSGSHTMNIIKQPYTNQLCKTKNMYISVWKRLNATSTVSTLIQFVSDILQYRLCMITSKYTHNTSTIQLRQALSMYNIYSATKHAKDTPKNTSGKK